MGQFEYTYTFEMEDKMMGCMECPFLDFDSECIIIGHSYSYVSMAEQFKNCPLEMRTRGGDGHFFT